MTKRWIVRIVVRSMQVKGECEQTRFIDFDQGASQATPLQLLDVTWIAVAALGNAFAIHRVRPQSLSQVECLRRAQRRSLEGPPKVGEVRQTRKEAPERGGGAESIAGFHALLGLDLVLATGTIKVS